MRANVSYKLSVQCMIVKSCITHSMFCRIRYVEYCVLTCIHEALLTWCINFAKKIQFNVCQFNRRAPSVFLLNAEYDKVVRVFFYATVL